MKSKKDPFTELGKLHGIPFCIKDQIKAKGYLTTLGVGSLTEDKAEYDANIVKAFKQEGAVLIVKGNTPII